MAVSKEIALKNVRLSYPNLYDKEKFKGEPTNNWSATLLLPKSREKTLAEFKALAEGVVSEVTGGKIPKKLWSTDKCCLRDGDMEEKPDYEDMWTIKASTNKRILTVDRFGDQVGQDDGDDPYNGIFYPGCMVDAVISIWYTEGYGHVRANLHIVRFRTDGEKLGGGDGAAKSQDMLGLLDFDEEDEADI